MPEGRSAAAGLWPSAFTRIDVELDPGDLEEDRPESMPGTWPHARVVAASTGYTLVGTRLSKGEVDAADEAIDCSTSWIRRRTSPT